MMLLHWTAVFLILIPTLLAVPTPAPNSRRGNSGFIAPAAGTVISPGANFDFKWDTMADYGRSSYNFTVFLFTQLPTGLPPNEAWASGYYLGRYAEPNYPGNPSPKNPAPAQLTMPDFSKNPGGFGASSTASDKVVYLAVMEEWADGTPNFGLKLNFAIQELVYNGTVKSA